MTVLAILGIVLAIGSINNRLTPTIAFADCFNLDEVDNVFLKNSRQKSESNSSLHYCIIEGENEHDNSLVKNLHAHHLISGKKYNLKNVQCGHSGCTTFRADIPSNINKRTYQLVVWTFQDELQKLYISKAVVE